MTQPGQHIFNEDCGIGYCLQCMGEFKASNQTGPFPKFACVLAPCPVGVIGVCYDHITVNTPSTLARPVGSGIPSSLTMDQTQMLGNGPLIPSTGAAQSRRR